MSLRSGDTIVAPASSLTGAFQALIRLSGPEAHALAKRVPEVAGLEVLRLDAPKTYTREPMVEIRLPASPPLVEEVIEALTAAGARVAEPGEFTFRAFTGGRIDLARAEAVLSLIRARDADERRSSLRVLEGDLSKGLAKIEGELLDLCAEVEAGIDFVDQEIEIIPPDAVRARAGGLLESMRALRRDASVQAHQGDEMRVLLFGRTSVGKSTLFNRLVPGADAIVAEAPGTTRDLLEGAMPLEGVGVPVTLVDSAGILEEPEGLDAVAVRRTREAVKAADLVLHVVDATRPEDPDPKLSGIPRLTVINKVDLARSEVEGVAVSALTGENLEGLRGQVRARLTEGLGRGDARYCLSLRQRAALQAAEYLLAQAGQGSEIELVAMDLREAASEIGSVTGREVTEEVLTRIFSRFCIGK